MADPEPDPDLISLNQQLQIVRENVRGVALGYQTGALVDGEGGIGKTTTIRDELRALGVTPRENAAQMTARGLFDFLREFPNDIFLVEDNESLFHDRVAVGILRSALGAAGHSSEGGRTVYWSSARGREEFVFRGGIIFVMNAEPPNTPEVKALLTRVARKHLRFTNPELAALMRHLAATAPPRIQDYTLSKEEATNVCEFVIRESLSRKRPLDLRLLDKAYRMYAQFERGDGEVHWEDRVRDLIAGEAQSFAWPADVSRATRIERRAADLEVVREILAATNVRTQQVEMWKKRTGKSARTFDSRKQEIRDEQQEQGSDDADDVH